MPVIRARNVVGCSRVFGMRSSPHEDLVFRDDGISTILEAVCEIPVEMQPCNVRVPIDPCLRVWLGSLSKRHSEEVRDESERTDLDWPYVMRFAVIWRERSIYLLEARKWGLPFQEII